MYTHICCSYTIHLCFCLQHVYLFAQPVTWFLVFCGFSWLSCELWHTRLDGPQPGPPCPECGPPVSPVLGFSVCSMWQEAEAPVVSTCLFYGIVGIVFFYFFENLQFKSRRFCLQVTAQYVCSGFTTWPSRLGRGRNWVDEDAWRAWKIWRVDDRVDFLLFYIAYLTSRTSHSKCDCVSAVPSRTLWSLRPRQESAGYVGAWLAFLLSHAVIFFFKKTWRTNLDRICCTGYSTDILVKESRRAQKCPSRY